MQEKFARSIIKQSVRRRPSFLINDLIIKLNIPLADLWPLAFWARADLDDTTRITQRKNQTENDEPTGFMLTLNCPQVTEKTNDGDRSRLSGKWYTQKNEKAARTDRSGFSLKKKNRIFEVSMITN